MHPELDRLATELWEFGLENSPSSATLLGDHRFDHLIEDLSEEQEAVQRAQLFEFANRAEAIDPDTLNHTERVTRTVMIGECRKNVAVIDSQITEMRSDQLISPHATMLHVAPQWMFPEPDYAEAYIERLHAIPGTLDQAFDRYRSAIRKGRPPARIRRLPTRPGSRRSCDSGMRHGPPSVPPSTCGPSTMSCSEVAV